MKEPGIHEVRITEGFWAEKLRMNAESAIFYQWEQLEKTHCIDNFRITAGQEQGFREGFFFADSDAYKWLDAACRILAAYPDPRLMALVNELIELFKKAQTEDGYLYTFNQIHFPGERWTNLKIQHELYCLGHLIEAGVSHFETTSSDNLLQVVEKTADLLVQDFHNAPADFTDGHEEIELALIKLWRVTKKGEYLELAKSMLDRRGRINGFAGKFVRESLDVGKRMQKVAALREKYCKEHPDYRKFSLPEPNKDKKSIWVWPRFLNSALNGKYTQQHLPVLEQKQAVGHSVRFTYLQTAEAMLARETKEETRIEALKAVWNNMVNRRMYVTGGIGSLPVSEGFGRDFELDPESAYAETCAALGSMLWNHEMAQFTQSACYEDLYEWQLYNAASVGIGLDGHSYFYNNPLECHGGLTRAGWYNVPCCPSNLSRVWAALGKSVCSYENRKIRINQYISSETQIVLDQKIGVMIHSSLPWENQVSLCMELEKPEAYTVKMRLPAWANGCKVTLNYEPVEVGLSDVSEDVITANGLHFNRARWMILDKQFHNGDVVNLEFAMPIRLVRQHERVPKCGGKSAVCRGPIVYCLEDKDNEIDIFNAIVRKESLKAVFTPSVLGGTWMINGETVEGKPVVFVPYLLWGNRGEGKMTVFVKDQ